MTADSRTPRDAGTTIRSDDADQPRPGPRPPASRLRVAASLARIEAWLQFRSVLVLAGLLAGGAVVWYELKSVEPLWWNAAWEIGYGQLFLAMTVLIGAHLATGRARRDGVQDLYASYPSSASTRTLAQLTALVGAALPSLLLIGGATAFAESRGAIGTPSAATLVSGILLVLAAGAIGVAVGTRFPHPLAGILVALVLLFVPFSQSNRFSGAIIWLAPWMRPDQLGQLPGPLAGYPPAGAHAVELAGLAVLAGIVALAVAAQRARQRTGLATAGVLAVAVICLAGVLQLRPISTADLNHLVSAVGDPAAAQRCTTSRQVRYCLYPDFQTQLPTPLETSVNGVLAHVPVLPAQALSISQLASISLSDTTLTHGHSKRQLAGWSAQLQPPSAPATAQPAQPARLAPTIDEYIGSWPAGAQLATARFDLALGTAQWAVNLPLSARGSQCVPLDQAREAIAIWLAILATHPAAGQLQSGLNDRLGAEVTVGKTVVVTWTYPGQNAAYLSPLATQTTAAGYLLAQAMTRLPAQQVDRVLKASWATWLDSRTTDAQLAAALGVHMPSVPAPVVPGSVHQPTTSSGLPAPPQHPLCSTGSSQ